MIIPVNYSSEEELLKFIEEQKSESPKVREQTVRDATSFTKPSTTPSSNSPSPGDAPGIQYVWGFFFMDFPIIYSHGNDIYFNSVIHKDSVNELRKLILDITPSIQKAYNKVGVYDPRDMEIKLHINSPGGCISSGFDLIDFIESYFIPITTIGAGQIASMAVPLVQAGKHRYVKKHTSILIHQFRTGLQGKRQDILDYLKHLENIHRMLVNYIAQKSKLTRSRVEDIMKSESWFTVEEAVDMGIVDKII